MFLILFLVIPTNIYINCSIMNLVKALGDVPPKRSRYKLCFRLLYGKHINFYFLFGFSNILVYDKFVLFVCKVCLVKIYRIVSRNLEV